MFGHRIYLLHTAYIQKPISEDQRLIWYLNTLHFQRAQRTDFIWFSCKTTLNLASTQSFLLLLHLFFIVIYFNELLCTFLFSGPANGHVLHATPCSNNQSMGLCSMALPKKNLHKQQIAQTYGKMCLVHDEKCWV